MFADPPTAVQSTEAPNAGGHSADVDRLRKIVATQAAEIEALGAKTQAFGDLQVARERLNADRKELDRDREAFEKELDRLNDLDRRAQAVAAKESTLSERGAALAGPERPLPTGVAFGSSLARLEAEIAVLKANLADAREREAKHTARSEYLERARGDLELESKKARSRAERSVQAADAARAEAARSLAEANVARNRADRLERELAGASMALGRLRSENASLRAALESRPQPWTSDPHLLAWMLQNSTRRAIGLRGRMLGWSGSGPFSDEVLDQALRRLGFELYDLAHESISHVVVGREEWSEALLKQQIDLREGKTLRIYSQEMLVAALITGIDPLESGDEELLNGFKQGHAALEFLAGESFQWPTIAVPQIDTSRVIQLSLADFGVLETPLHLLGYRVGATSPLSQAERRQILADAFEARELPAVESDEYMEKWGTSRSHQRLWRMADHIARLVNGPIGHDYRKGIARRDWIDDLGWLKETFYKPRRFKFAWPDIRVADD